MRRGFDFRLLPFDILKTLESMIENIFPHLTTRQSKGVFLKHGTLNSWRKLEID
jgi:hypothetical protein